jgi:XTP/dITP diphosphohydrolase
MTTILFATHNPNKLKEVRQILADKYKVVSLEDIQYFDEIPEPFDTIRENSIYKAQFFYKKTKLECIAEDSGLEVDELNSEPSAYSARYAGTERNDLKNLELVLEKMKGQKNRSARFISIFTYYNGNDCVCFEGVMKGQIAIDPKGDNGFGYDPIFIANGESRTNAELSLEEKNSMSHRKKALSKLISYFQI